MPSVKNKIRDVDRLLRRDNLDDEVKSKLIVEKENLEAQYLRNKQSEKEKQLAIKYHKVKFFERKKVTRKIRSIESKISPDDDTNTIDERQEQRKQLENDLAYIMYFPKDEKYISLYSRDGGSETENNRRELLKERALNAWTIDKNENEDLDLVRHAIEVEFNPTSSSSQLEGEDKPVSFTEKRKRIAIDSSSNEAPKVKNPKKEIKEIGEAEAETDNNNNMRTGHSKINNSTAGSSVSDGKGKKEKKAKRSKSDVEEEEESSQPVVVNVTEPEVEEALASSSTTLDPFFLEEVNPENSHLLAASRFESRQFQARRLSVRRPFNKPSNSSEMSKQQSRMQEWKKKRKHF